MYARDNDGNSPLHLAAQGGHGDLVYLLLGKGAASSPLNDNCQCPYSLAPDESTCWNFWQYGIYRINSTD